MNSKGKEESFGSRFTGLLVIIMTSLGLGNIWRFPYLCAEFGGAAFVVAYLLTLLFIVSIGNQCEIVMGKFSKRSVVGAFTTIGRRKIWRLSGWIILCLNLICMVYYNVLIGWVFRYFFSSISGSIWQAKSPEVFFDSFVDTPQVLFWVLVVNAIIFTVLFLGLKNGVEKAATILGPVLFVIMIIMVIRTFTLPGVDKGMEYYLVPKWEYLLQFETWVQAIGQGLWSGVFGWGIMITMGSYMKKREDVGATILVTTLLDGGISWLVGLALIPACIVFNVPLDSGMNLSFLVMPQMFMEMPYGSVFLSLFYGALAISGLGAAIGCIEAILTVFVEEWSLPRKKLVPVMFTLWMLAAIPSCLSKDTLDWLNNTLGTYAILVGGFVILIFVGYCWGAKRVRTNVLNYGTSIKFGSWWDVLVKYVAPSLLAISGFGFIKIWLLESIPGYIAWPLIIVIIVFNIMVLYNAVRYKVPQDIGDNGPENQAEKDPVHLKNHTQKE